MNRNSALRPSVAALAAFVAWWGGVLHLDGALAAALPYHRYEAVALLYPDAFYPALPGWILAHAQPFAVGLYLVALGWMVALPAAIGTGAARYAPRRDWSPTVTAVGAVVALFVAVTAVEAVVALVA